MDLTVIFPLLLASSLDANAFKNGFLRSLPVCAKVLKQQQNILTTCLTLVSEDVINSNQNTK